MKPDPGGGQEGEWAGVGGWEGRVSEDAQVGGRGEAGAGSDVLSLRCLGATQVEVCAYSSIYSCIC